MSLIACGALAGEEGEFPTSLSRVVIFPHSVKSRVCVMAYSGRIRLLFCSGCFP